MEKSKNTAKARKYATALHGFRIKMLNINGITVHIGEHAPISMVNFAVRVDVHVANTIWSQTSADESKLTPADHALHNCTHQLIPKDENRSLAQSTSAKQTSIFTNAATTPLKYLIPTWMLIRNATPLTHA